GPGGHGTPRLALQVAVNLLDRFEDGVWFVSLATLRDPSLVALTIAQALGVREVAGAGLGEALRHYLQGKRLLLLLDNFEHLLTAAPAVAELLASCPGLKALTTSRER